MQSVDGRWKTLTQNYLYLCVSIENLIFAFDLLFRRLLDGKFAAKYVLILQVIVLEQLEWPLTPSPIGPSQVSNFTIFSPNITFIGASFGHH